MFPDTQMAVFKITAKKKISLFQCCQLSPHTFIWSFHMLQSSLTAYLIFTEMFQYFLQFNQKNLSGSTCVLGQD